MGELVIKKDKRQEKSVTGGWETESLEEGYSLQPPLVSTQ